MDTMFKMSVFIILNIFILTIYATAKNEECGSVTIRGKPHKRDVWVRDLKCPYQLSFYKEQDILFYTYDVGIENEDTFEIAYYLKHNKTSHIIHNVTNGFATAIDQENHTIYIGSNSGIYKCNPKETNMTIIHKFISKFNIWSLIFKKHLYFISYPSQRLFEVKENNGNHSVFKVHEIKERIYHYAIDGNENQYIVNKTGLYKINATLHRTLIDDKKVFTCMTADNKGEIHFCDRHSGIYVHNKHNNTLDIVVNINNVYGLTFDKNNTMIVSNNKEIVSFVPC